MNPEPLVVRQLRETRERLLLQEASQMQDMARRWLQVEDALEAQFSAISQQMAALKADGRELTQAQLFRQERYRSLLVQARREIDGYVTWADDLITQRQGHLAMVGLDEAALAIDNSYTVQMVGNFTRLPVSAVENMIGLAGNGSPLRSLLIQASPDAINAITKTLITNTALGKNPRETARQMAKSSEIGLQRSLVIARTEQLRVFREASRQQYIASGVVRGYRRMAAHNGRTCAACLALDGQFYPLDTPLADHPSGRCCLVPAVKGVSGPQWQSGEDWLRDQPEAIQRETLGAGHYDLWKAGMPLEDMVHVSYDPVWGESVGVKPLKALADA